MKIRVLYVVLFSLVFSAFLSVNIFAQEPKNSAELTSKIADHVRNWGKSYKFNEGMSSEGVGYESLFFKGDGIYKIVVRDYNNGSRNIYINYYLTNRDFDELVSAADFIAKELMFGQPKIYVEIHISDYGVDGGVNVYQTFTKKTGSVYGGFTREDRDKSIKQNLKTGIREHLWMDKKVSVGSKWRKATLKENGDAQEDYQEILSDVAEYWNLIKD